MIIKGKMKIGILTYHRSHNYGALLQAIALRKVLADMGNEVTFIDYWPEYHRHMYEYFSMEAFMDCNVIDKLKYVKNVLKYSKSRRGRISNFNSFIVQYIVPFTSSVTEEYDLIVHGSDQIWRKQPEWHAYNPVYFGKHDIKSSRRISYAASMGILPDNQTDYETLRNYLSYLNQISVREADLGKMVRCLGFECTQQIDPTLLLTGEEWARLLEIKSEKEERYVLYYKLLPNSFEIKEIEKFTKNRGLTLKILHSSASRKPSRQNITTANPKQFLKLVYNADYVFTSSFHGLVFSILFHKPFYAAFSNNAGRASSLLSLLGLSDRLLTP